MLQNNPSIPALSKVTEQGVNDAPSPFPPVHNIQEESMDIVGNQIGQELFCGES